MEKYFLNSNESYNLYKICDEVCKLLESNGIMYWASGGTFLGAIRCKGIIKWDDDLDLCVLLTDKNKLENILEKDDRFSFILKKDDKFSFILKKDDRFSFRIKENLVHKIFYKNQKHIDGHNYSYPFVDIFFMSPIIVDYKNVYVCSLNKARNVWKNEYYLESELMPLIKKKFGEGLIYCPNQYKRYFIANFGENWDKEGVISYNHKEEKDIEPVIKWKLTKRDYEPAFPFYVEESFQNQKWWEY